MDTEPNEHHQVQTSPGPDARYCSCCGTEARGNGLPVERFGEAFCSDEHAEEFAREMRVVRAQAVARAGFDGFPAAGESESKAHPRPRGWKRYLTVAACCGAPPLAIVLLAGGGGALLGAVGGLLPALGFLACPLAMFFMMRAMAKMEHRENPKDDKRQEGDA